jgi:hypothetical protein
MSTRCGAIWSRPFRVEVDYPRDPDALEKSPVVRDQEQRALESAERALQLLDGRQVEVVRRLVEDEATRAASRLNRELGARPLARRQASGAPDDVLCIEVELRQQRPRLPLRQAGRATERVEERFVRGEEVAVLPDLAEDSRRPDAAPALGER